MKVINCGIIGSGVIAPSHIESYMKQDKVKVTWLCDLDLSKARKVAAKYDIVNVTTDFTVMLNDPDLDCVSVCTDHGSHARIVCAALEAGKHVICEKALGISLACLEGMIDAHRRRPELIFAGVFQHRFEKVNRYVKELIERGVFGVISILNLNVNCLRTNEYYRQDAWRGTWKQEGGALLINQAIHFVDLLQWISGGIAEVSACCSNLTHHGVIEAEDTAAVAVKFKRGMVGVISATSSSVEEWRQIITISGSDGYIEMMNNEPVHFKFSRPEIQAEVEARFNACREEKLIASSKDYYGEGHPGQIADFIDSIRAGHAPFVPAESAQDAVKIVLACYESDRTGQWVKIS